MTKARGEDLKSHRSRTKFDRSDRRWNRQRGWIKMYQRQTSGKGRGNLGRSQTILELTEKEELKLCMTQSTAGPTLVSQGWRREIRQQSATAVTRTMTT